MADVSQDTWIWLTFEALCAFVSKIHMKVFYEDIAG
jgi:hypothetical protein